MRRFIAHEGGHRALPLNLAFLENVDVVADEPGYWARLASQPTIPEPIRAALASLD